MEKKEMIETTLKNLDLQLKETQLHLDDLYATLVEYTNKNVDELELLKDYEELNIIASEFNQCYYRYMQVKNKIFLIKTMYNL